MIHENPKLHRAGRKPRPLRQQRAGGDCPPVREHPRPERAGGEPALPLLGGAVVVFVAVDLARGAVLLAINLGFFALG